MPMSKETELYVTLTNFKSYKEVLPEFCVSCIEKEHCVKRNREECFKENKEAEKNES